MNNYVLMVLVLFPLVLAGSILLVYGIYGGLVAKRILKNQKQNSYLEGRNAVARGVFYIVVGAVMLVISILAILKEF